MEACTAFKPWHDKATGRTGLKMAPGKCATYCFYLIDPALIDATYAPQISEADQAQIGARPEDELCLRVIVTVGQAPEDTTINLAAPLVLNLDVGLGCQAILDDNAYGLRVPVIRRQD